jgi:hypothetical protein
MENKFYNQIQVELKKKGIKKNMFDIKLTAKLILEEYDQEDKEYLLSHEDEYIKAILAQYDFEVEFDEKHGNLMEDIARELLKKNI